MSEASDILPDKDVFAFPKIKASRLPPIDIKRDKFLVLAVGRDLVPIWGEKTLGLASKAARRLSGENPGVPLIVVKWFRTVL